MRGQPHGPVVKISALHSGGLGSVPRQGPTPVISSHAVAMTHVQNRGRLAQLSAQGQSSSPKKKQKWCLQRVKKSNSTQSYTMKRKSPPSNIERISSWGEAGPHSEDEETARREIKRLVQGHSAGLEWSPGPGSAPVTGPSDGICYTLHPSSGRSEGAPMGAEVVLVLPVHLRGLASSTSSTSRLLSSRLGNPRSSWSLLHLAPMHDSGWAPQAPLVKPY